MSSLAGKIALVTGASRGIGLAISDELASRGAIVIGSATSKAGADEITNRLSASNGLGIVINLLDTASTAEQLKELQKEHGTIDILINNAGMTNDNLLLRMKDEQWLDVIQANLSGVFPVTKACLRGMTKNRWGRIVNVSSVVASTGNPGQSNYAAAKAGIEGFTRSLAQEIASRGITVNSVAPGFIQTPMTDKLTEDQAQAIMSNIPTNRLGQPSEIAKAVAFLVSDDAAYITGQVLHVNGGMNMG
jgi:3-oxoacyl-[acyl-carrier protein] reductase